MAKNATHRFSDRVENYIKYRPGYPSQVIDHLRKKAGLSERSVVADIGSGTGIFTKLLLDVGCKVFAVEPNEPMRAAAEALLKGDVHYISVGGSADNTTLEDKSVNIIVCAQAFHWFNTPETKNEFERILADTGFVALIWNNRIVDADEFATAYDQLLQQKSTDYKDVNHQNLSPADFAAFFLGGYEAVNFPNSQLFDEAGFIGRAYSSSYVPAADTPEGKVFLNDLKALFEKHQKNGTVTFKYRTEVYLGRV